MVSALYQTANSISAGPEKRPENDTTGGGETPLFLTASGSRESHAVVLSDGRQNRSHHAGRPYRGISWSEILKRTNEPTGVEKNDAPFVIPSTCRDCEGRTHAVQRERGEFWFLAVDIDAGSPSLEKVAAAVSAVTGGARAVVYSSSSAAPDRLKWRVLIPLAAPISGAEYPDTQKALFGLLKQHGIVCDVTLARAAQPVYLPNVPPGRRGSDGRPIFYRSLRTSGPALELIAGSPIVEARDALRATAARAVAGRAARAAEAAASRQARIDAGETITDAVELFRLNNDLAGCLKDYRFTNKPGTDDWKSPLSKSGSFSTRNMGGYWVTVSAWAKEYGVGRETKNGHHCGDAFDLFVHFEHGGDRRAAIMAYLVELGLRADGLDDVEPVVVETPAERGPARDLSEWRQDVAVERALAFRVPGLHLDHSPTGSGKTFATTRAIIDGVETTRREAEQDDSVVPITRTLTVLPDHGNIRERVQEMRAAGLDAVAYPARDETTCGNLEAVRRAEGLGLTAGATICAAPCPLRDTCLFNKQHKQAEQAPHAVATHERLRLSPSATTKERQVIIIDETPEAVLAPSVAVRVDDFNPVIGLASTVRDDYLFRHGRAMEPTPDERSFAGYLTDAHAMIVAAAQAVTEPGVVEIPLPPPAAVPDGWQKTLLRWAVETGFNPGNDRHKRERFQKAVRLLTMIVTGKIERLHLLVDQTSRHKKQADGTVQEWENLHHFVVGSWRTKLPNVPVICLDATATADDLRAATGREVHDCTPEGHLPNVAPVVQIPFDVTAGMAASTAAGFVVAVLDAHPEIKSLGVGGHQDHIRAMMTDDSVLPPRYRERVKMHAYYGQGPDRGSNTWYGECDAGILVGTMRPGSGPVKERLVNRGQIDAARRDGDWGIRHWEATTTDGRKIVVEGKGYRDCDWHQAHVSISRAAMIQFGGRWRTILETGKPVWIISDEPMGVPVDDSLEAVSHEVRATVEAVRVVRDGGAGTELHPIRRTYSPKFGSQAAVRVHAVIEYMRSAVPGRHGKPLGLRAVEKRLALALKHGRLERPERGWLVVAGDQPATVPEQAAAPQTASVALTEPAVVISATGPASDAPVLQVVAVPTLETTTSLSTATAPASPPPLSDDLIELLDERAAIMEFDAGLDAGTADRLASEAVMGRSVVEPLAPAEPVGVDHASLAARFHPLVDAAIRRLGGTVRVLQADEDQFQSGRPTTARPPGAICSCGSDQWIDVPLHSRDHAGRSIRRDCARCDKFIRYVRWYGKPCGPPDAVPSVPVVVRTPEPNVAGLNPLSFLTPPVADLVPAG
jgi:hypothetical protein